MRPRRAVAESAASDQRGGDQEWKQRNSGNQQGRQQRAADESELDRGGVKGEGHLRARGSGRQIRKLERSAPADLAG